MLRGTSSWREGEPGLQLGAGSHWEGYPLLRVRVHNPRTDGRQPRTGLAAVCLCRRQKPGLTTWARRAASSSRLPGISQSLEEMETLGCSAPPSSIPASSEPLSTRWAGKKLPGVLTAVGSSTSVGSKGPALGSQKPLPAGASAACVWSRTGLLASPSLSFSVCKMEPYPRLAAVWD